MDVVLVAAAAVVHDVVGCWAGVGGASNIFMMSLQHL